MAIDTAPEVITEMGLLADFAYLDAKDKGRPAEGGTLENFVDPSNGVRYTLNDSYTVLQYLDDPATRANRWVSLCSTHSIGLNQNFHNDRCLCEE